MQAMQIERVTHHGWSDAYRCTAGAVELVVVTQIGPRILSLRRRGGTNLLYEDDTAFAVGDWRLYGGHRFTVAPEGPQSYEPDNWPCAVTQESNGLRVQGPISANGLGRSLVLRAAVDGEGFDIVHELQNCGSSAWTGALWAITCVPLAGVIGLRGRSMPRFWPETNPGDWEIEGEYISVHAHATRGKVGWHSSESWLASLQPQATLVIQSPNTVRIEECVDDGCNVEIFVCKDYLELETLSGQVTVLPGAMVVHEERWRLLDSTVEKRDWPLHARRSRCVPRSRCP